jgi:adenylate cyclase
MQEATRLNPYHPDWYWVSFSEAYFVDGQYQEAATALEKIAQPWSHVYKLLAGNYAQMNRLEDARAALAKFLEMEPQMTVELAVEKMPFKRREDLDRLREALRKAGLPEKSAKTGT